ncbi:hypothetical protein MBLNU459_g6995t1 [Dothideomycetes sp. NU459]
MAPVNSISLSPAELAYIHTSLAQTPPIRPDGRTPTQFRPLVAESDILPSANGSARICFADGTEAVVGVKAEVEKSSGSSRSAMGDRDLGTAGGAEVEMGDASDAAERETGKGSPSWVEVALDIPGYREDDALPVFLSAMLTEALVADGSLKDRLYINTRFHWRLYIDILLLSAPLSYPLPLLSLTTHLALLSTRLPALVSEKDEDPLFNDDWDAATLLYPQHKTAPKPPVTLLVVSVADNILFDASSDELAVADSVLAVSVGQAPSSPASVAAYRVLALRTIDPPSRLTASGTPNALISSTSGAAQTQGAKQDAVAERESAEQQNVWRTPRGGVKRALVSRMLKMVTEKGGVAQEVLEALGAVET